MSRNVPLTELIAQGKACTVECVVRASGVTPALEFLTGELEQLREKSTPDGSATARFVVLFSLMAEYGKVSAKRFKTEMDGFCAFRHEVKKRQIRFPCFLDGTRWIITHGFFKPGAKKGFGGWPDSEVKRAKELRAEYFRRKAELASKGRRQ